MAPCVTAFFEVCLIIMKIIIIIIIIICPGYDIKLHPVVEFRNFAATTSMSPLSKVY